MTRVITSLFSVAAFAGGIAATVWLLDAGFHAEWRPEHPTPQFELFWMSLAVAPCLLFGALLPFGIALPGRRLHVVLLLPHSLWCALLALFLAYLGTRLRVPGIAGW